MNKLNILAINGSASRKSSNSYLLHKIAQIGGGNFDFQIVEDLSEYPAFRTELTDVNVPDMIEELRKKIVLADGIIISTPEYVFSIPSGLKNIIEWCVSTTVFSDKPIGIITASANGEKGHEELQLIMKTVMAKYTPETTLLIQGIKGKINDQGDITDDNLTHKIGGFVNSFVELVKLNKKD